jgi:hypothetical protein
MQIPECDPLQDHSAELCETKSVRDDRDGRQNLIQFGPERKKGSVRRFPLWGSTRSHNPRFNAQIVVKSSVVGGRRADGVLNQAGLEGRGGKNCKQPTAVSAAAVNESGIRQT